MILTVTWILLLLICSSSQHSIDKSSKTYDTTNLDQILRNDGNINELRNSVEKDYISHPVVMSDVRGKSMFFPDFWNILGKVEGTPKSSSDSKIDNDKITIDPELVRVEGPDKLKPAKIQFMNPSIWGALKEKSCNKQLVFNLRNTSNVPIYGQLSAHITTPDPNNPENESSEDIAQKIIFLNATMTELQRKLKNSTTGGKDFPQGKCDAVDLKIDDFV
ncbi:hypothetical protein LSTR_LSTR013345 [Laodelphax striatellus]|uniref:Uncharacterized protein n=1 Tax=Laodelphax striatellus TaxID=195883 RepID=A0A482WL80_LAOST|nr:hypothetical protein LSTR_LSTR013345 [Laodelphax striatellus]